MAASSSSWGQVIGSVAGQAMGGPVGALIGNLVGGAVQSLLISQGVNKDICTELKALVSSVVQSGGSSLAGRLTPAEKKRVNHDMQTAFRDAFQDALYDVGGAECFRSEWKKAPRDVPAGIV